MADSYTEVTTQNWFSRLGESFKGILMGLILVPFMIFMLWCNESEAVTYAKSLKEGAAVMVEATASKIDPGHDRKLVHVMGEAAAASDVVDTHYGIRVPALRLVRQEKIYQWVEHKKTQTRQKTGGSEETTTTYTYERKWADSPANSTEFNHPEGHENRGSLIVGDANMTASKVSLGAYRVPESFVKRMGRPQAHAVAEADLARLPVDLKSRAKLSAGVFYFGTDPQSPQIGDVRVSFEVVPPGSFSILAAQVGDSFEPYQTKAGDPIDFIESGEVSAEKMFKDAAAANAFMTWVKRFFGFVIMAVGFILILRPLSVLGSVVPLIGNIIGLGAGLIAFVLAGVISFVVIAVAWIFVRPLLALALLAVAAGGVLLMQKMAAARKPAVA